MPLGLSLQPQWIHSESTVSRGWCSFSTPSPDYSLPYHKQAYDDRPNSLSQSVPLFFLSPFFEAGEKSTEKLLKVICLLLNLWLLCKCVIYLTSPRPFQFFSSFLLSLWSGSQVQHSSFGYKGPALFTFWTSWNVKWFMADRKSVV